ncbi:MAG TPA: hypothetical protein VJG49_02150 [Candidatus Nanoarchaeia archaeon]|nr:hypothetical protein [Candidatus Nanoarchaeia archaeon]
MVKKKKEEKLYPAEEQGITKRKTSEQIKEEMDLGEADEDVYSEEGLEKLEADDELEPWEEGFMEGAKDAGQFGKDALTGEPLMDVDDVVETEIDGKFYRFTNKENAIKFKKKKKEEKKSKLYQRT